MAEAAASIEDSLSCTICLSVFSRPKALPCLHTFCEKCLSDHIGATEKDGCFVCPLCKSKTQVPKIGVEGFPDNFYFNSLIDSLNIASKTVQQLCELCQLDNVESEALFCCVQCGDNLCESCSVGHTKTRMTRGHEVVKLGKDSKQKSPQPKQTAGNFTCPHHAGHFLDVYCKNCDSLTCVRCQKVSHATHTCVSTKQATEEIKAQMHSIQQDIDFRTDGISKAQNMQSYCEDEVTRLSEAITEHFDDLRKSATQLETQLLSDVKSKGASTQDILATQLTENQSILKVSKDLLVLCEKYINCADEVEKRQQLKPVMNSLFKQMSIPSVCSVTVPMFSINCSQLKDFQCKISLLDSTPCLSKMKLSENMVANNIFRAELRREDEEPDCFGIHFVNDRYLIADGGNGCVKVYGKRGNFHRTLTHGDYELTRPCDVTGNEDGEIFVTDNCIHGICHYDEKFRQKSVSKNIYKRWGRIACLDSKLLVTGNGCLSVLAFDREWKTEATINASFLGKDDFNPNYVATTPEGNIVTTCKRCVYILSGVDYSVLHKYCPENIKLENPMGVCCDQWGHIFIVDHISVPGFRMHAISSTTGTQLTVSHFFHDDWTNAGLYEPTGITISGHGQLSIVEKDGDVYVCDYLDQ